MQHVPEMLVALLWLAFCINRYRSWDELERTDRSRAIAWYRHEEANERAIDDWYHVGILTEELEAGNITYHTFSEAVRNAMRYGFVHAPRRFHR